MDSGRTELYLEGVLPQGSIRTNSDLISTIVNGDLQTTRTYEQNRNLLTQVKNEADGSTLSQFDYANDAGGKRTSIKYSGSAFETGASFNKYEYNNRSEVLSGDRYWGANLNDTSEPVTGQGFAYAYDNIGNRNGAITPAIKVMTFKRLLHRRLWDDQRNA